MAMASNDLLFLSPIPYDLAFISLFFLALLVGLVALPFRRVGAGFEETHLRLML